MNFACDNNVDEIARRWATQFEINRDELSEEVMRQPASFSYFATRAAKAESQCERKKFALKLLEAQLSLSEHTRLSTFDAAGKRKPPTVAQTDAAVHSHPDYIAAFQEYIEAQEVANIYSGDVRASTQKGKCLELLALGIRQELAQRDGI